MVDDITLGILTTVSNARIHTFLIDAGFVVRALLADDALWATVGRVADVVGDAGTHRPVPLHLTDGVRSARRWHTRVPWFFLRFLFNNWNITADKRISLLSRRTSANRVMVDHVADGIKSTSSRARIGTLLIDTSLGLETFRADDTLRLASWDDSFVSWKTGASRVPLRRHQTSAVRATRGRIARVARSAHYRRGDRFERIAVHEWVSGMFRWTITNREMVNTFATRVNSARSCTGVFTFVVDTSPVMWTFAV